MLSNRVYLQNASEPLTFEKGTVLVKVQCPLCKLLTSLVLSGLDGDKDELHDCRHCQNERVTYPYRRQVLCIAVGPSCGIS